MTQGHRAGAFTLLFEEVVLLVGSWAVQAVAGEWMLALVAVDLVAVFVVLASVPVSIDAMLQFQGAVGFVVGVA